MRMLHTWCAGTLLFAQSVFSAGQALAAEDQPLINRLEGPQVITETVTYRANGEEHVGLIARDAKAKGRRPGILLVHEWWGLNSYARKRAEQLAGLGYVVMAVDMYGGGRTAEHPQDAKAFSSAVMGDWPKAESSVNSALAVLRSRPEVDGERMAAIGYCFGGGVVLNMALSGAPLKAVVSFHGSPGIAVKDPKAFAGRVVIQNGEADSLVPQEGLDSLLATFKSLNTRATLIQYPGAKHAFTNPESNAKGAKYDLPLAYDAAADAASWQVMLNLFNEVFKSPKTSPQP
ncbi:MULTISPECIES: dienelactone hydrolase family protein [Cobetia]|uniref:Dienelactone hydrolase family protein n=1 Tax=Cobetia crustatorum TaxID=553385 RepID=A0A558HJ80_9GAMM|nr:MULTISPECIES: dienelactone hydrolase family protein [Cobetia]TVU69195.1 dienelactone hydrolase family protein [Cobetia crustatorum]